MMRIETFSPENLDEGSDLEKKMVKSDVVMPADIASYAEEIAGRLEELRKGPEKEAFVLDALSIDRMKGLVKSEGLQGLTDEEIEGAMDRIRKALIEALKGKIEDKLFFVVKNLQVKKSFGDTPDVISEVTAGGGTASVHKRQPTLENFKRNIDDAFEVFKTLPPHENIAKLIDHDPSRDESLWEKRHILPLNAYMLSEKEPEDGKFLTGLTVVKDCIQGAIFLAENGLVLQDIHPRNLGLERTDEGEKGVLFDFGALVKEGDSPRVASRLTRQGYAPPVGPEGEYRQGEMTFQFGKCLDELVARYERAPGPKPVESGIMEVKMLVKKMLELDTRKQMTLEEAKSRLEAIIAWTRL